MSGHSWSFPNVCKGVTKSCLALGSLLLLECAQGTDKWLDPWLSSQCEQKGEGEEPGWFGSLMEAPSWKFLGALHTQHYERRRNLPNHRKGLSREGLSPRPSPAGESCQPGGAQCQEAPCLLLLSCEVILGEATSPSGWCTEMCRSVFTCVSANWSVVASALQSGALLTAQEESLRVGGRGAPAGRGEEPPTSLPRPPAPRSCPRVSIPKL